MNLGDMSKPLTSQFLNETSAKRYGQKLKLSEFSNAQLHTAKNKLSERLHKIELTENYNSVNNHEQYHRDRMFLDVINAEIKQRNTKKPVLENKKKTKRVVKETVEQEAELIMAAKDMVDKLSGWMEHTAEMQSETILSLGDAIRMEKGTRKSHEFINIVRPALEGLYASMEDTRTKLINGVDMLTGQRPDMGVQNEPPATDDMSQDDELSGIGGDTGDSFASSPAAKGGSNVEGRSKRESIDLGSRLTRLLSEKKK